MVQIKATILLERERVEKSSLWTDASIDQNFETDLGAIGPYGPIPWCLVFRGDLYGPMALKVCRTFPPKLVLVHGWLFPGESDGDVPRGQQNRHSKKLVSKHLKTGTAALSRTIQRPGLEFFGI